MKRSGVCAKVIFCSLLCLLLPAYGQVGRLRFPESRSYSPGQVWLGWSSAERTGFVRGFIMGHGDGYQSGCRAAKTNSTESQMAANEFDPCLQQRHLFRKEAPITNTSSQISITGIQWTVTFLFGCYSCKQTRRPRTKCISGSLRSPINNRRKIRTRPTTVWIRLPLPLHGQTKRYRKRMAASTVRWFIQLMGRHSNPPLRSHRARKTRSILSTPRESLSPRS